MKSYPNSLFPHFNKRQQQECPECPVCFNCQLPTNTCANGGACDPSGACICPIGWGKVNEYESSRQSKRITQVNFRGFGLYTATLWIAL